MSCRFIRSIVLLSCVVQFGALGAQTVRVAALDATRNGTLFNIVDGTAITDLRRAIREFADTEIVPLDTLVDLDAGAHDVVMLHNAFSGDSPMASPLSEEEQRALREFVEKGGAAWVAVDSYEGAAGLTANAMLAPFDITLGGLADSGFPHIEDPGSHPVTRDQHGFRTHAPSWFTDLGPCATALVSLEPPGGPLLAVIESGALVPGSGRVVLASDANWIGDQAMFPDVLFFEEHEVLFLNMLAWLTEDVDPDAPAGDCDADWEPTAREGTFELCGPLGLEVNSFSFDYGPSLTRDGLCLVFESARPGGKGQSDLYMATRETAGPPFTFSKVVNLEALNSALHERNPNISPDGLKIYFGRTEEPDRFRTATGRIFFATRSSRSEAFGEPSLLEDPLLPEFGAGEAVATEDDLTLIFEIRDGGGNTDLFEATREAPDLPFESLRPLSELNTLGTREAEPSLSADGLSLFFERKGVMWWTTRPRRQDESGAPVPFGSPRFVLDCTRGVHDGNVHKWEGAPFITPDWPAAGSKLYFSRYSCNAESGSCGGDDIWEATLTPTPASPLLFRRGDCNDDGTLDISDAVCILNWLFLGGATPGCAAATNTNGDERSDISDATYLLNHLFLGGSAPVAPFPECGPGTLPGDEESCETPPASCRG